MPRDAKELLNLPVLTTSTGKEMGAVDRVLFEPGEHHLYGLVVKHHDKDEPQLVVPLANIKSFGDEAITIEDEQAAVALDSDRKARNLVAAGSYFSGMRVITEDGNEVGKVDTVLINDDGSIAAYRTGGGLLGLRSGMEITPTEVVSAGEDAIIVLNSVATKES